MLKENVKSASRLCRFLMLWVFWECCFCPKLQAQKTMTVTDATQKVAFKNGETAQYDLYYNWKFMWIKAGMGTMSATMSYYNGQPAYRIRILSRGTHQADRFFVLRDTLTSYMTPHLLPLAYTKTDMERDKYRVRHVWFSYQGKKTILKQQYINPYGKSSWKTEESNYLIRVLENVASLGSSDLFSQIATQIFEEPLDETSISQRLALLREAKRQHVQITSLAEQKVKAKLSAMAADPERGPLFAMKYMSPLTLSEQCLMTEWVGHRKIEKNYIKILFPELYAYLLPSSVQTEKVNGWINEYFQEHCLSKVGNSQTENGKTRPLTIFLPPCGKLDILHTQRPYRPLHSTQGGDTR